MAIQLDFGTPVTQSEFNLEAFTILKRWEGVEPKVYLDSKNIPSIGIGFNLTVDEPLNATLKAFGFNVDDGSPPTLSLTPTEQALENQYIADITDLLSQP